MAQAWDESYDAVIVGSGAAGLTAAVTAAAAGLKPLVIEKAQAWGGTSALSGGGIWIPANRLMQAAGGGDSVDAAMTYLDQVVAEAGPASSRERRLALLNAGPEMIGFLLDNGVGLEQEPTQPDYHAEQPGGRKGRLMEPVFTNGKRLGPWLGTLRPAPRPYAVKTGESSRVGRGFTSLTSTLTLLKVVLRHRLAQLAGWTPLTGGRALAAQLMMAMQRAGAPVRLGVALRRVVVEDGRAVGVEVEEGGRLRRIEARAGVMLCAGGFAHDSALRMAHQGVDGRYTSASPDDTGDVVKLADGLGAETALMDEAWWGPCVLYPGDKPGFFLWERSMPGSLIVDGGGRRFTNESQSYNVFGQEMLRLGIKDAWLILDARHRRRYLFGAMRPGRTPQAMFDSGFFVRGDTLGELARKCGVDPAGLAATVERFNGFARTGVDEDFGRGSTPYDNYWGDPAHRPSPNLGTIEQGPFLATRVHLGDLGTKGGLLTDEDGRVLRPGGEAIEGLYAAGNSTASVMGRGYPGPGVTLAPAMTFAFLAARHAARRASNLVRASSHPIRAGITKPTGTVY
ncbi:FAD-dependent oxidoreductase [Phenylobacterium sp.]|jgi:3-oxosteroid 1-dehydrogenase|uniref:FAD-dependent oxidoreductase n=1 Tax=Phenylobacterium sp. TaxID=1871053 RepID=UPI002F419C86